MWATPRFMDRYAKFSLRYIVITKQYRAGGQPPFELTVVPVSTISLWRPFSTHEYSQVFGTQLVYNLSDRGFKNGVGTFNTRLTLPTKQQLVLVMSDATGFATGGVSPLLTVESATPGGKCNTSTQSADFYFTYDHMLNQCR